MNERKLNERKSTEKSLGIDFGTCYSSAAFISNDLPVTVKFGVNKTSLPSSIYIDTENILVGMVADNRGRHDPMNYRREFKRELGNKIPYQLNGRQFLPEQLVAEVLKKLKDEAEKQTTGKTKFNSAVVTVPVSYKKHKRNLIIKAAKEAGFSNVELLDEPVAAAIYHIFQTRSDVKEEKILVYDLGGGTFDASLIFKSKEGKYESLAESAGHDHLGGTDFDLQILADMMRNCKEFEKIYNSRHDPTTENETDKKKHLKKLRLKFWAANACQEIKHHLSEDAEAREFIPETDEEYVLQRADFEQMLSPFLLQTCEISKGLITSAGLKTSDIDVVLLVGGSCRIPCVEQTIKRGLKIQVKRVADPELAVCWGAAISTIQVDSERIKSDREPLINQYKMLVKMAWADKKLEEAEIAHLNAVKQSLSLEKDEAAKIEREIIGKSIDEFLLTLEKNKVVTKKTSSEQTKQPAKKSTTIKTSTINNRKTITRGNILNILKKYGEDLAYFYIFPNIPAYKESAARKAHKYLYSSDKILALYDNTYWESGKYGLVFTNIEFIYRGFGGPPEGIISYKDFLDYRFTRRGNTLSAVDYEDLGDALHSENAAENLLKILNAIQKLV